MDEPVKLKTKFEYLQTKIVLPQALTEADAAELWESMKSLLGWTFRNRAYCKGICLATSSKILQTLEKCSLRAGDALFPLFRFIRHNGETLVEFSDKAYRLIDVRFAD